MLSFFPAESESALTDSIQAKGRCWQAPSDVDLKMMTFTSYKNAYTLPPPPIHPPNIHLTTPPEAFDLNFCLSEPPIATLAGWGTQVRLEPFIVRSITWRAMVEFSFEQS
jgi:hypothetical protein